VDEEVHRLIDAAHQEVTRLLNDRREQLESLAQGLLKAETLDAPDAYAAAGVAPHEEEPAPAIV
jgi:cell division protease FtsH